MSKCEHCKDVGFISIAGEECRRCEGAGYILGGGDCWPCYGTGKVNEEEIACEFCEEGRKIMEQWGEKKRKYPPRPAPEQNDPYSHGSWQMW